MNFNYDFFLIDINEYENVTKINESGRFGKVEKATKDGEDFIIRSFNDNDDLNQLILREVETLSHLRCHPAICRFYGYSLSPFQMVFEYLPNKSLQSIFDDLKNKKEVKRWNGTMKSKTIFGIACAIHHLHNHDTFHRYLTPSCILYDKNDEPRLTDFIFSRRMEDSVTFTVIKDDKTPYYQAPEIHTENYDKTVDSFSFGMILYHIVSGKLPSESKGYNATKEIVNGVRPEIPSDCDPRLKLIINDCWQNNPDQRPLFIDIIKALKNYDNPLFPDADMLEYKKYRERLLQTTYFTEQDNAFLKAASYSKVDETNFDKALEKANQNDVKFMMIVARMFELGIGTDISLPDAIEWYQKAAAENNAEALYKVANFYLTNNEIFDPSEEKYFDYLKKSCSLDYEPAISDYAHCLSKGSGTKQDVNEAIKMLEKIANPPKNNMEAQYRLSELYDEQGNEDKFYDYLIKSKNQNFPPAKQDYAIYLLKGKGKIHQNIEEGMKLLKQVAQDGFPMANSNLGIIYEKGKYGQPIDAEKAKSYHLLGLKDGSSVSMVELGKAYYRGKFAGKDFEKDEVRAARLFEKAADLNDPEGLYSWAIFELKGNGGTLININDAIKDLKTSASLNFPPAMFKLYELFNEGINGVRDPTTAQIYLQQASDLGFRKAVDLTKKP